MHTAKRGHALLNDDVAPVERGEKRREGFVSVDLMKAACDKRGQMKTVMQLKTNVDRYNRVTTADVLVNRT
jgi:hypothetical protein